MDHFFCSISSLMSLNLHSAVYSSIDDLVQFIEMYKLGNDFSGLFERSLPVLPQPITLTVVRDHFICLSRIMENVFVVTKLNQKPACFIVKFCFHLVSSDICYAVHHVLKGYFFDKCINLFSAHIVGIRGINYLAFCMHCALMVLLFVCIVHLLY